MTHRIWLWIKILNKSKGHSNSNVGDPSAKRQDFIRPATFQPHNMVRLINDVVAFIPWRGLCCDPAYLHRLHTVFIYSAIYCTLYVQHMSKLLRNRKKKGSGRKAKKKKLLNNHTKRWQLGLHPRAHAMCVEHSNLGLDTICAKASAQVDC